MQDLAEVSKLYEARKGAYGHADAVVSMTGEQLHTTHKYWMRVQGTGPLTLKR